jgi:pyrroline-5-carboxylate reductase
VRAMPNTPALIGQGIAGLYARHAVTAPERSQAEQLLAGTGRLIWVAQEPDLDAVTALSGSGPAYVFYVIEALMAAAREMGLSDTQGRELTLATMAGATALARASSEPPELLRQRVTSQGGTTEAALRVLESHHVKATFIAALRAAQTRAVELGDSLRPPLA